MGYYDFDDHFWSPHEVCKQKSQIVTQEEEFSLIKKLQGYLRRFKKRNTENSKPENEVNLPNKNSEQPFK